MPVSSLPTLDMDMATDIPLHTTMPQLPPATSTFLLLLLPTASTNCTSVKLRLMLDSSLPTLDTDMSMDTPMPQLPPATSTFLLLPPPTASTNCTSVKPRLMLMLTTDTTTEPVLTAMATDTPTADTTTKLFHRPTTLLLNLIPT